MELKKGDKVKIIDRKSVFYGKEAVVALEYGPSPEDIIAVRFEGETMVRGYFPHELEKVLTEEEEISKIASILYNEPGNEDWEYIQALKAAESLYKAGVRFRG